VLKADRRLDYPCELYLEGSDQHRGWFQSALIIAMAIDGKAPYKNVLTHGFVVDGEGKKMSKSLGNVIAPQDVMKKYGADILRLWVMSSDYSEDVRLSDEILTRLADAYKKIRNTFKYLLSNLYDFEPAKDSVPHSGMLETDRWILSRLAVLVRDTTADCESYAFHKVFRSVYNFCVYEVSSIYLDILKDRMYTFKADSAGRRSGQTAAFELLTTLLEVTAPFLAITTDEAWAHLKGRVDTPSVHLEGWPDEARYKGWLDEGLSARWQLLINVREAVLKKLEDVRQSGRIGSSLDAKVTLRTRDAGYKKLLNDYKDTLRYLFITSQVVTDDGDPGDALTEGELPIAIDIDKADGRKCSRCWNYSDKVGEDASHPTICERCVEAVR
jgi:isoleucyl-tRNA synthetase